MAVLLALVPPSGHPGFLENLSYQAAGLAVVLVSLTALSIIIAFFGRLLNRPHPSPATARPRHTTGSATTEIPPETLAVIAAAVAVSIEHPHRIVQVRGPRESLWLQAWSVEGRRQIFQSHRIR